MTSETNTKPTLPISNEPQVPLPIEADDEINLGELIATLMSYKWVIALVTALSILLGGFYLYVATPVYQADALLQVEDRKAPASGPLQDLQSLLGGESVAVTAQIEILKSRMILERVVQERKLDIVAEPNYFPIIGRAIARRYQGQQPAAAILGLGGYAWGGERIQVESLIVPEALIGQPLTLVAKEAGRYELLVDEGSKPIRGVVGHSTQEGSIRLFVSELVARPGTHFTLVKKAMPDTLDGLLERYEVKERAKQSGVIAVTLSGTDRERLPQVLDAIVNTYVRQNVEYRSAEAESTLKFIEEQLPKVKSQVDAAEAALNRYRQTHGSVDLTLETKGVLDTIVSLENDILQLQQKREDLGQRYTPEHPAMQALESQLAQLKAQRGRLEVEVTRLPATQQNVLKLQRDFEVANKLYTDLLNSAQQLRLSKAGTIGDARIIDHAVVGTKPVSPKIPLVLAIALVLGVIFSLLLVWILQSLRVAVEDPDLLEKSLGLPVYATIPHSLVEARLAREIKHGKRKVGLLAIESPDESAVESLRGLRTTIHFALLDAAKGSVLITGPSPDVGKSFVTKNLGAVLAQAGKRVVIVDADLRKGHIHREFNLSREKGVSEFIAETAGLAEIIKSSNIVPNLSIVTTGTRPPNPAELLMNENFRELLDQLSGLFDIIIVDAPPILAVSDAAIIGRHTGATLMIVRAGRHPMREVEQAVKRLAQAGVAVKGLIFNDMDTARQRYRYGYKGYVYQYSYK